MHSDANFRDAPQGCTHSAAGWPHATSSVVGAFPAFLLTVTPVTVVVVWLLAQLAPEPPHGKKAKGPKPQYRWLLPLASEQSIHSAAVRKLSRPAHGGFLLSAEVLVVVVEAVLVAVAVVVGGVVVLQGRLPAAGHAIGRYWAKPQKRQHLRPPALHPRPPCKQSAVKSPDWPGAEKSQSFGACPQLAMTAGVMGL
mmetsp:Transcript_77432/g.153598  ORF Transcript_77432/g.153598 Transcript_77432/m.153598 type:complete len:196 (+) Transcript_77432:673-1260(+)